MASHYSLKIMEYWILIFVIGWLHLFGDYPNFYDNPLLTTKMKEKIEPHLIPLDHPSKPIIDSIFSKSRVVQSEESIVNAGFSIISIQYDTSIIVARHPLVPGYVFKFYRDSLPNGRENVPGWECLVTRCVNVKKIEQVITSQNIKNFKVPSKWIYILPLEAVPSKKHQPIALLATDMELESPEKTRLAWKTMIAPSHLDELYILFKAGYGTSALIDNLPLTKHGTFAFIDTEKSKRKIKMHKVEEYFSKDMRHYWRHITH